MLKPKEKTVLKLDRQVTTVRYSPCGRFLMAGGFESVIYRWDNELKTLPPLKGHGGWVQCLAFSSDKKTLFSADSWGQLRAWDYANGKTMWKHDQAHDGWIRALAVSPDGKMIATSAADQKVCLWSVDGKKIREHSHSEDIFCLAFHPEGKSLVFGDLKGKIEQRNVKSGKMERSLDASVLFKLHRLQDVGGARVLQFNERGDTLACAGTTPKNGGNVQGVPTMLFFDWKSGEVKHTIKIGTTSDVYVHDLHLQGDVVFAVTSGNPGVGKFFIQKLGEAAPMFLSTKMSNCHSLAMHPDGKQFVISATNRGSNGNGRRLNKKKEYEGNSSPLHVWTV